MSNTENLITYNTNKLIRSCVELISDNYEGITNNDELRFIKTGFEDFDAKWLGLQVGTLIVLAGSNEAGKTNLMLSFAKNMSIKNQIAVGIMSLRLSAKTLMMRVISSSCDVDINRLNNGMMQQEDWKALSSKIDPVIKAPLFMQDKAFSDVDDVLQRIEQLAQEKQCQVIFIDDFPFRYCHSDHPVKESERFVFALQKLARKLNVVIVLTAGVNYNVDKRQNPRPKLSDLLIHGDIVSAADMVMCLYSDEIYHPDTHHKAISELAVLKGGGSKILLTMERTTYCRFIDFVGCSNRVYTENDEETLDDCGA